MWLSGAEIPSFALMPADSHIYPSPHSYRSQYITTYYIIYMNIQMYDMNGLYAYGNEGKGKNFAAYHHPRLTFLGIVEVDLN